jgi:hypothetical protein
LYCKDGLLAAGARGNEIIFNHSIIHPSSSFLILEICAQSVNFANSWSSLTMKHIVSTFFLFLLLGNGFSQPHKFGKITDEQWEITNCDFDPGSTSLILFDVGTISILPVGRENNRDPDCRLTNASFTLQFERHYRIKVLINNGLAVDHISLDLRSVNDEVDYLYSFQGILFTQTAGKTEQQRFTSADLKEMPHEEGSSRLVLELNEIKAGSILDIRYTILTRSFYEIQPWDFIGRYPNLYSEVTFSVPDFYSVTKKCDIINSLTYDSFSRSMSVGVSYSLHNGWRYYSYSYTNLYEQYSLVNIPSSGESDEMFRIRYITDFIDYNSVSREK